MKIYFRYIRKGSLWSLLFSVGFIVLRILQGKEIDPSYTFFWCCFVFLGPGPLYSWLRSLDKAKKNNNI